ncbi:MAG: hypothetical protein IJU66_09370 [Oscillospiraceae bacterium]|nr:hypothetical protein [Oscillospiraceae bacterium]
MAVWKRIPVDIDIDADRRTLAGILTAHGLEVRVVKIKETNRGTPKRYLEYRDTGCATPKITSAHGKNSGEVAN